MKRRLSVENRMLIEQLLRLNYIKKYKLGLYFDLLVNDKLNEYLHNIDTIVMEKVQKLIKELTEKEKLKSFLK